MSGNKKNCFKQKADGQPHVKQWLFSFIALCPALLAIIGSLFLRANDQLGEENFMELLKLTIVLSLNVYRNPKEQQKVKIDL